MSDEGSPEVHTEIPQRSILTDAENVVASRHVTYGHPVITLSHIAELWHETFGWEVTAEQVALAMILVKIARSQQSVARDNLVDIAGYARILELLEESNEAIEARARLENMT